MNSPLRPALRPIDEARACRFVLAFTEGNRMALDQVLEEVGEDEDRSATVALIFALAATVAGLVVEIAPDDYAERLRSLIAAQLLKIEEGQQ